MSEPIIPGAEGHLVCPWCRRYFDPATGETPESLKTVLIAGTTDKDLCKPCREKAERGAWPER